MLNPRQEEILLKLLELMEFCHEDCAYSLGGSPEEDDALRGPRKCEACDLIAAYYLAEKETADQKSVG